MMRRVADDAAVVDLHLRMPSPIRAFGTLLALAGAVGVVVSLVLVEPGAMVFAAVFGLLGVVVLRTRVDTDADGVTISGGVRRRTLRWTEIESFRVLKARFEGSGPGVFAIVGNGEMVKLPLPLGGGLFTTRRRVRELDEHRADLERLCRERTPAL